MATSQLTTPIRTAAFDRLADTYDEVFTSSRIGRAQRGAVWQELERAFHPGQRILEINCGTGVDAVYLASRGVEVLACDVAPRMIEIARQRLVGTGPRASVDFRVLGTEGIATLENAAPFDGAFSNFGGLNCIADLPAVARDLARLLRPGARALLCLFGSHCAWEIFWYLAHGDLRKAFRRFHPGGTVARLAEEATIRVRYPSVHVLARIFAPHFRLRSWKGVGVAVPPTYLEPLGGRFPKVLGALAAMDRWLSRCPVLRGMADHVLLEFEQTGP